MSKINLKKIKNKYTNQRNATLKALFEEILNFILA